MVETRQYNLESAWNDDGAIYYGEDDSLRKSISDVFLKLPEEVRD